MGPERTERRRNRKEATASLCSEHVRKHTINKYQKRYFNNLLGTRLCKMNIVFLFAAAQNGHEYYHYYYENCMHNTRIASMPAICEHDMAKEAKRKNNNNNNNNAQNRRKVWISVEPSAQKHWWPLFNVYNARRHSYATTMTASNRIKCVQSNEDKI